jgi:hypothetical protein
MDLTNRVLIAGVAFLWILVIFIIIFLAWGFPDQSIERLGDLAGYLEDHNTTGAKLIITFGGLILALLAVLVIIFEMAPPETGSLKVAKVGTGEARIGTDEISHRLEEELRALPQVNQVQVSVLARGQKAEVNLNLHVAAEADLAATTEEACRRARQLIEERMGVALTRPPQAQLHYRELRVARPQEASPPAPSEWPLTAPPPAPPSPQESPPTANPPVTTESSDETSETSQEDRPAGA